jgi:hypothetical protein
MYQHLNRRPVFHIYIHVLVTKKNLGTHYVVLSKSDAHLETANVLPGVV